MAATVSQLFRTHHRIARRRTMGDVTLSTGDDTSTDDTSTTDDTGAGVDELGDGSTDDGSGGTTGGTPIDMGENTELEPFDAGSSLVGPGGQTLVGPSSGGGGGGVSVPTSHGTSANLQNAAPSGGGTTPATTPSRIGLYAGIGVVALLGVAVLIKKKRKSNPGRRRRAR